MSNPNLYIVGADLGDLDGEKRLDTLLNTLAPSVVILDKNRKYQKALPKSPEEEQIIHAIIDDSSLSLNPEQKATLIEYWFKAGNVAGYELRVSTAYVARTPDSKLEYLDLPVFAGVKKGYVGSVKDKIKQLEKPDLARRVIENLDGGIDAYVQFARGLIQQLYIAFEGKEIARVYAPNSFTKLKGRISPEHRQELKKMDYFTKNPKIIRRIKDLCAGERKVVVVVGLEHFHGLRINIEDLNPTITTLREWASDSVRLS